MADNGKTKFVRVQVFGKKNEIDLSLIYSAISLLTHSQPHIFPIHLLTYSPLCMLDQDNVFGILM